MSQTLLVGPASEPLSLTEAKDWLRVDGADEDDLVSTLIVSARLLVEQSARRLLITQTWRIYRDAWPADRCIVLPIGPIASISAVRVRDAAGVANVVDAAGYVLDAACDPARVIFTTALPTPAYRANGIEIDVVAGYGGASAVPAPLREAMRLLIANWYENRGDGALGAGQSRFAAARSRADRALSSREDRMSAPIGALRRRLILQTAIDTLDDTGATARAFVDGDALWAQVQPIGAKRDLIAGADTARVTHRVVLRWRGDITVAMRFKLDDRILAIRSLVDIDEERRWLQCLCEETSP